MTWELGHPLRVFLHSQLLMRDDQQIVNHSDEWQQKDGIKDDNIIRRFA